MNKKKSTTIHLSFPKIVFNRIESLAEKIGVSVSEIMRMAFYNFENQYYKDRYGRYGGIQIGRGKTTRLMREEKRAEQIEQLQSMSPEEIMDFLIAINYLDPDRVENDILYCYRIKDEAAGRMLYQLQINQESGEEIYSRLVFTLEELIKDLIKTKKI